MVKKHGRPFVSIPHQRQVIVAKPVVTTVVLSGWVTLVVGEKSKLTAHVYDQRQHEIKPTPNLVWTSSNLAVATLTSTGTVTGVSIGSSVISATTSGITSSLLLTVSALPPDPPEPPPDNPDVLTTVTVTPSSILAGEAAQAYAKQQDGNLLSNVVWTSSAPSVATVASSGGVTALTAGSASIRATFNGVTLGSTLAVSQVTPPQPPTPVITTVTLNPFSIVVGQTSQATASDQNGNVLSGVSWVSSNLTLATVSNSGVVTAFASGTVTITGTLNAASVPAALNITAIVVPPPSGGSPRLLVSTDLQYLGMLKPTDQNGVRMDFSYGSLSGRRVAGQVRLFMTGNRVMGDPLYEFSDPGGYSMTLATAPKMPLVRAWGNIYGNCRVSWDTNGNIDTTFGGALFMGGVHWSEAQQLFYWTYYNSYNTAGLEDWSLGATALNLDGSVTPSGPWRVSGNDGRGTGTSIKKGPWRCTKVAEHPTTGKMLTGATLASGNNKSPWGPELWEGTFPTAVTPSGFGNPDLTILKYLTYYPMFGRVNTNTGTWSGALTACRRPGDYFFEPAYTNTHIDPTLNGSVGTWTDMDIWGDVTWIDLPDRYGVLYTGKLAAAHVWYSTQNNNHVNCFHGFAPPTMNTGPVATDSYPAMWIYDPEELAAVMANTTTDFSVNPAQTINAQAQYGIKTAPITAIGSAKLISGQYFDPVSRKLYIAAPDGDTTISNYLLPIVHVFQVN